ncbi:MAG: amino acid ABC transporter substrate-binding protein [Anaerolineae bacterium]
MMSRKPIHVFSILVVLAMLIVACGRSAPAPAPAEPAEEAVVEPAGTIRIGASVSETGKYAREGDMTRKGYDLWVDYVNNELGGLDVGGQKYLVEIVYYDDESDPETSAKLVEKLITEDKVDFILGPYSSGITKSTSAITEKYGVIMVEGNGAAESLFERGFENLFAVLTPASFYTKAALELVAAQGAQTVVILYEDTAFPTAVANGALKWADALGLEVLAVETYPKDVADVSAAMTKFKDLDPDVFVGGGHFNDALLFLRQSKELDFNPDAFIITVGPSSVKFIQEMGSDSEYVIGPVQWHPSLAYEGQWFGSASDYRDRFVAMFGEEPDYHHAESTAAALALGVAIQQAGSLDTDAVRQALQELNIDTFYGPIAFDETGKNNVKPMVAIQILNAEHVVVAPAAAASVDVTYPLPTWSERAIAVAEPAGTIRIGASVSETGKYAREGDMTRKGYDLWVDYVNNELGGLDVGGQKYLVEIVYYDDESDPETSAKLVEKLITEDKVDFILGPYSSGITKSTSAITEKYGVIMVEGNGAAESLFERGFENLFAVLTPASFYTKAALELVAAQGAQTVVILYEDTAFPTAVANGALKWADALGLEVLAVETYPKDVADVSAAMTKFKDLDPDVFVGGGHFNDALLFLRQSKELDFNPDAFIITVGPSSVKFIQEMGSDSEYVIGPVQWHPSLAYEGQWFGSASDYRDRFVAMFGEEPDYHHAESTAAALALGVAIQQAGSLDTDAVRQALQELNIDTFYGPIAFDETGKNNVKPMVAIQILNAEHVVVAPAAAASVDVTYPLPTWSER